MLWEFYFSDAEILHERNETQNELIYEWWKENQHSNNNNNNKHWWGEELQKRHSKQQKIQRVLKKEIILYMQRAT